MLTNAQRTTVYISPKDSSDNDFCFAKNEQMRAKNLPINYNLNKKTA